MSIVVIDRILFHAIVFQKLKVIVQFKKTNKLNLICLKDMLENDKIKKNHWFRIKYELVLRYYMDTIHVLKSLKSRQFLFRKKWDTTPNYIIVIQDLFYIPFEGFVWLVHHCLGLIQSRAELLSHGKTILTIETHKLVYCCTYLENVWL